jgi:hypothetical protein
MDSIDTTSTEVEVRNTKESGKLNDMPYYNKIRRLMRTALLSVGLAVGSIGVNACGDVPNSENTEEETFRNPETNKYDPLKFLYLFVGNGKITAEYVNPTSSEVPIEIFDEEGNLLAKFFAKPSDGDNPGSKIISLPDDFTKNYNKGDIVILEISIDRNKRIVYKLNL